ncbi:MAG: thioesterase family protein [Candidatus Rokubacteria bacterium]|nr:thioesterase family protein [Candidatus Rokubacteria bacterium]
MTAAGWVETYRGTVYRWELDHNDHFTVAYYFQRFGDAAQALLAALGLAPGRVRSASLFVRYISEFHAGGLLHIDSGVIDVRDDGFVAGHTLFDSESGAVATTVEHRFVVHGGGLTAAERRNLEARRVAWDAAPCERRPPPVALDGFRDSARDVIKPAELDGAGHVGLAAYIHRFSAANGHAIAAFGMTAGYMQREHRGFSTFEFQFALTGAALAAGDMVRVRSALLHVGSSSMRIQHRMTNERTGQEVATLEQFGVHLDMDARKSTPLPDAIRAQALAVLVPTT